TTLSLNSITDSQAPTNLSFNPSIKLRNVSDLLYAMTKPAASAAIPATTKPIGLANAPSAKPAILTKGAKAVNVCIILPNIINTGPAETANPANTPINFCVPLSKLENHITKSLTFSITVAVNSPNFTPQSAAVSPNLSNISVISAIIGFI